MAPLLDKHLPLHSNASHSSTLQAERRTDHYSHFILRLAFSTTEDLRRRFARLETALFRLRYRLDDVRERREFTKALELGWEEVEEPERAELADELRAAGFVPRKAGQPEEEGYFKVDWERVPELVEGRKVLLKRGVAYVPVREQISLVVPEFTRRLDEALEVLPSLVYFTVD
jgi:DNA primase large subunit